MVTFNDEEWSLLNSKVDELITCALDLRGQRDELLLVVRKLSSNCEDTIDKEIIAAVLARYTEEASNVH